MNCLTGALRALTIDGQLTSGLATFMPHRKEHAS